MWECMTSETRKGRNLLSRPSRLLQSGNDAAKEALPPDSARQGLIFQGVGIRRDKTSQMQKMRASARQRRGVPASSEEPSATSAAESQEFSLESSEAADDSSRHFRLSELYQQASQDIASLASRLAQHNGLRQFSATFSNRAPPLELRMLLPELEASIEQQLQSAERIYGEISQMQFCSHSRMEELKCAVCSYLRSGIEDASVTFEEQRSHLRALKVAAPLTSPMTMPVPAKKFANHGSPPPMSLPGHFESFSTVSTQSSPNMPELQCDDWPEEDGEEQRPTSTPFAAVMSSGF